MTNQDLVLNISVNMSRVSRWAPQGNSARISQFMEETSEYISELQNNNPSERFKPTLKMFVEEFNNLKNDSQLNEEWAENALTWASILSHRAKLA